MNKEELYITYDFECLGNSFNAPIIQIGAVKFNINGEILDEFQQNIKWESLQKLPFTMDYSTVKWWMQQTKDARDSILDQNGAVNLKKAFSDFRKWIDEPKDYKYFTHATYDAVIFSNTCKVLGIDVFIPFRLQLDIRTLHFIAGDVYAVREGIHHSALADAQHQANYISKMLRIALGIDSKLPKE